MIFLTRACRAWWGRCLLPALLGLVLAGCGRTSPERVERGGAVSLTDDEFSIVTYNLWRYGYADRDRNGQADNFKPDEEITALMDILAGLRPDILAVQELGSDVAFAMFRERLVEAGLDYPHAHYLPSATGHANLGLLSRFPLTEATSVTSLTYTVRGETLPVSRGFIDAVIELRPGTSLRVFLAHLKSKRFHEFGQTEMRRNEARLLSRIVRERLAAEPTRPLMVLGDLNDTINSAPLRELTGDGAPLVALRLADEVGDVWTHAWMFEDIYSRIDYMLVNQVLLDRWVPEKSGVVRDPQGLVASDHRPLYAVFRISGTSTPEPAAGNTGPGALEQHP